MPKRKSGGSQDRQPRKKTLADRVTIIRKRYMRESARYERQAAKAAKEGKSNLASKLKAAASTAKHEAAAWKLGVLKKTYRGADLLKRIVAGEKASEAAKYSAGEQVRRERLAKSILSTEAGAAFYAGTIDIWRGKPYEERDQAILEALGVDNLFDAIVKIESETGIDLLEDTVQYDRYADTAADIAVYISGFAA